MASISPSWDYYRSFLMVLRTGSLSAAARALGVKQSTVGRQIASLESELGVALFTRSQKGLRPTDAAIRLKPHLEIFDSASDALIRDVQKEENEAAGVIRLTTSETVGSEILPKVLIDVRAKLPRISFEISISDEFEDLLSREADIAIRTGPLKQKAIVTRKVGELEMGLFASKEYMRRRALPKTDQDLNEHSLIGLDKRSERVRRSTELAPYLARTDFAYFSDSMSLHARLIDSGCGVGLCWADRSRTDRVRILPQNHAAHFTLYLAMHENLRKIRKYRAVFTELAAALKTYL